MREARKISDRPFLWAAKAAVRRLRDIAGESNRPAPSSVAAVYFALCEAASDAQAEKFEISRGRLAAQACVNVRTLDACLPVIEKAGLLEIERRRIDEQTNLPSRYTLLSSPSEINALGSDIKPLVAKRTRKRTTAPFLKNELKNGLKKCEEAPTRDWPAALAPEAAEALAAATGAAAADVHDAFAARRDREIKFNGAWDERARASLRDDLRALVKARPAKTARSDFTHADYSKFSDAEPEPANWRERLRGADADWLRSEADRPSFDCVIVAARQWLARKVL